MSSHRNNMNAQYVPKTLSTPADHSSITTTLTTTSAASDRTSDLQQGDISPLLSTTSDDFHRISTDNQHSESHIISMPDHHHRHLHRHSSGTLQQFNSTSPASLLSTSSPESTVHNHHGNNGTGGSPSVVADEKLQRLVEAQAMQFELLKSEVEKLLQDNNNKSSPMSSHLVGGVNRPSEISVQDSYRPESPLSTLMQSRRVSSPSNDLQTHRHLLNQLRKLLRDATSNIQVPQDHRSIMGNDMNAMEPSPGAYGGRVYELMQDLRGCQELLKEEASRKSKLAAEVERLEMKASEMRTEIGQLSTQLEATRTQRTQLSSELQNHRKQISELSEALSREKSTKLRVENQLERVGQLQDELKTLKATLIEEQNTRHQLMSEVEKLRKIELLESKRVSELSSEVISLKTTITTQQSESSQFKTELSKAHEKAETLEAQLAEADALRHKALEELKKIGTEHLKALEHQQNLQDATEALNAAQSENQKLADEIARFKEAQSVRTCELGREVRQLTDALKEEQLQKYKIQEDLTRQRDAESERYQELSHEVERLCASLGEEQSQKSQLAEELSQLREEALRVAEASQETRALREQVNKEQHQKSSLMEELRRLQAVHDTEIATTIKLHEELRRLQRDFDEEQSLRIELAEKIQSLEMRKGSYSDLSSELRAENELLWSRLEEARAKEGQVADELNYLRNEMSEFKETDTGRLLDELESTKIELESVRHQLESLKSQDDESMMTSEEGSKILVESLNGQIESLIKEVATVKESHVTTEASLRETMEQLKVKSKLLEERSSECENLQNELSELSAKYNNLANEPRKGRSDDGVTSVEIDELTLKLTNLEAELQDTLMQKVKAEEEVVSLRFELASNRSPRKSNKGAKDLQVLQDQIATLESENRDLKDRLDSIEDIPANHEMANELSSRIEELQSELLASTNEIQRLKDEVQSQEHDDSKQQLQERLDAALASIDGLSRTLDARAEERQELVKELETTKAEWQTAVEELDATKRFLEASEEEVHGLKTEKGAEVSKAEAAKSRCQALERECDRLSERLGELESQKSELEQTNEKLKLELDGRQQECEQLRAKNEDLAKQSAVDVNEELKRDLDERQKECDQLRVKIEDLAKQSAVDVNEELKRDLDERQKECDQLRVKIEDLANQSTGDMSEELKQELIQRQSECDQLKVKNDELSSECVKQQKRLQEIEDELRNAQGKIEELEADSSDEQDAGGASIAESTRATSSTSSAIDASSDITTSNNQEIEALRVQLKATQLGFLKEIEKVKKLAIPNFTPRMSTNLLSFNQRNLLAKIQELEAGKFEIASVAALPHEKVFNARELHVEASRLEGIASAQSAQLKKMESELENTKSQLAKVEAGWKEEYRFYSARQTKLQTDLEDALGKNEALQRALEETKKAKETEKVQPQQKQKGSKSPQGTESQHQRHGIEIKKLENKVTELESKLKSAEKECREAQAVATMISETKGKEQSPDREMAEQRFWIGLLGLLIGIIFGWIFI